MVFAFVFLFCLRRVSFSGAFRMIPPVSITLLLTRPLPSGSLAFILSAMICHDQVLESLQPSKDALHTLEKPIIVECGSQWELGIK